MDNDSPLHDDEQAFLPLVHVLVEVEDPDDVGPSQHPEVQLNLPPGFGSVIQDLRKKNRVKIPPNNIQRAVLNGPIRTMELAGAFIHRNYQVRLRTIKLYNRNWSVATKNSKCRMT